MSRDSGEETSSEVNDEESIQDDKSQENEENEELIRSLRSSIIDSKSNMGELGSEEEEEEEDREEKSNIEENEQDLGSNLNESSLSLENDSEINQMNSRLSKTRSSVAILHNNKVITNRPIKTANPNINRRLLIPNREEDSDNSKESSMLNSEISEQLSKSEYSFNQNTKEDKNRIAFSDSKEPTQPSFVSELVSSDSRNQNIPEYFHFKKAISVENDEFGIDTTQFSHKNNELKSDVVENTNYSSSSQTGVHIDGNNNNNEAVEQISLQSFCLSKLFDEEINNNCENDKQLNLKDEIEEMNNKHKESINEASSVNEKIKFNQQLLNKVLSRSNYPIQTEVVSSAASASVPPPTSASRKIAVKKLLKKYYTVTMIARNKSFITFENKKSKKEGNELEFNPLTSSQVMDNEENLPNIDDIKSIRSQSTPSLQSIEQSKSTLSEYNLDRLMESYHDEFENVDIETFNSVKVLMNKMLKVVCRKLYLYDVGILQYPKNDDNDEENIDYSQFEYFNENDHIFQIDQPQQSYEETDILEYYNKIEELSNSSTEISDSDDGEYFSYLKLDLNDERNVSDEHVNKKPLPYISSEENSELDNIERQSLSNYLKQEFRNSSYWVKRSYQPFSKSKVIETRPVKVLNDNHVETGAKHHKDVFHDDYFLSEMTDEIKHRFSTGHHHHQLPNIHAKKLDKAGKQQTNANLISSSRSKTAEKNPKSTQKSLLVKRREERIHEMEKIFSAKSPRRPINLDKIEKNIKHDTDQIHYIRYHKPSAKSNLRVKIVPYDYVIPPDRLPSIPISKPSDSAHTVRKETPRIEKHKNPLSGPVDERQKYPRPVSCKQPWGTIVHPPYGLGYQKMTPYEISQSVNRLYYIPKKQTPTGRAISCLPKSDFERMMNRLTFGSSDKAADRCRTQGSSIYREMGVLNSYAWKGYHSLQKL